MSTLKPQILEEWAKRHETKPFVAGKTHISPSGASIDGDDIVVLVDAVLDGWFTEHKWGAAFSRKLREVSGKKYTTLVNSGSSADLVAVQAMVADNPAPYVIVPAASFPTTVSAIYHANKIPVYVDTDPRWLTPIYEQVEDAFEHYGDAICGGIFTHNLGFRFDEYRMRSIFGRTKFVSDCCDAMGTLLPVVKGDVQYWYAAGEFADLSTYSFFPAHHITTGQGGSVNTSDKDLHNIVDSLCHWGRSCFCLPGQNNTCGERFTWKNLGGLPEGYDHKYVFDLIGYNLQMTELQAALGASQADKLSTFTGLRRKNYRALYDGLSGLQTDGLVLYELFDGVSPFGFPMMLPDSIDLNKFVAYLEDKKIGTRRFFGGNVIRQPGFMTQNYVMMDYMYGSDELMNKLVWIGCHPNLTNEMIDYMLVTIVEYFDEVLK